MKTIRCAVRWLSVFASLGVALSQATNGSEVYQRACATCHEQSNIDRMPQRAVIARMSPENVLAALTGGVMKLREQAFLLPNAAQSPNFSLARPSETKLLRLGLFASSRLQVSIIR